MQDLELAAQLPHAVVRFRRALQRAIRDEFAADALSPAEVELLLLIARRPGIGVAAAAIELGSAPNTVSTLVRKLLTLALVRRDVDPDDRRSVRLGLTETAESRLDVWRTRRTDVLHRALGALDEGTRRQLGAALPALDQLATALDGRGSPHGMRSSAGFAPSARPAVDGNGAAAADRGEEIASDDLPTVVDVAAMA